MDIIKEEDEKEITRVMAKTFHFTIKNEDTRMYVTCKLCGKRFYKNSIYKGGVNMRMIDHHNVWHKGK